jgi:hypothetical protein
MSFICFSGDDTSARCRRCAKIISKGPAGSLKKNLTTAGMESHLKAIHPEAAAACADRDAARKQIGNMAAAAAAERDETAAGNIKMYNLRTHEERGKFLDMVRPPAPCPMCPHPHLPALGP